MSVDESMRRLDNVEVAKIWIRGGNLDKIP